MSIDLSINLLYVLILMKDNISKSKQTFATRGIQNSVLQWTKQKTERDVELWGNEQHYWIVDNKFYDLSRYIKSHPGGSHWLQMTKGQDITEHFITHHLNEQKARIVLAKYYVGEANVKQDSRFSFKEDGLFRTVKKKLLQKYTPKQLQNTSKSVKDGCIMVLMWTVMFLLTGLNQSFILAILCGFLIYPIIGVAHNFIHMKNHPFRYLWLFTGFTHQEWQQMHCLSHHSYANTLIDYQIQAFQPVIYYLKVLPKNNPINWLIKEITLMMLTPFNILIKLIIRPIRKQVKPQWFYLVPLMQLPLLWLMTGNMYLSFKLFVTIHISFSILFSKLTFLGHRTGYQWTAGNRQIGDFGEHQVYASSDTPTDGCKGFWSYFLYAGFNYHAIHHFFPTIDNHQLPEASSILEQEANKKGIKLNKIKGVFWALLQIEKNFFNRRQWQKSE